ncbi:MAG: glycerol-3-phosphate 1-O-acyltransferase [Pseudomonadota bacterium]
MTAASQQPDALSAARDTVLYILDASHRVEESLLRDWLATLTGEDDSAAECHTVVVPIARSPEDIPSRPLSVVLDLPAQTRIVPLRVAWLNSVDNKTVTPRLRDLLWGNPRKPGAARARRILRRHSERAQCIAGDSATLEELRQRYARTRGEAASPTQLADFIAGQAGLALDIAERRLRGSRYKVPRQVAKNMRNSPDFRAGLQQLSAEESVPLAELQREAADIMKELVSIPRTFWLDAMGLLNRKIISLGYETDIVIDEAGLERVRQITREYPTALLWTHKTHVDGFAMHWTFFKNDFPAPHLLGGVNMAFGGLGFMARRAGGIFIRRSFQDDRLYKFILRSYIGYLLEKRFPLTWAFEGTRSRVGKLMPPRYGILKYVIEAAHGSGAERLHIIPVAINYDLIGDVADYASEQAGGIKRPESLRWFIGYLRGLRQPMGSIYMDFGEPVVLEHAPSPDDTLALQKVAFQVGVEVNKVSPITLPSLVTMILLGAAPRALTARELRRQMDALVEWARRRDIRMTSVLAADAERPPLQELAENMVRSGLITSYDGGPERVYAISAEQDGVASYYRNTTIHHFVNKAIAELAMLKLAQFNSSSVNGFWEEAERLRDLFKFEFFYAPSAEFRDDLRAELCRYDPHWEQRLADESGFAQRVMGEYFPLVAHATLLHFVDAYRIVADVLARQPADAGLDEKTCVSEALAYGRQAYLQRRISSQASIGKLLFQNAWRLLDNRGLTDAGGGDDRGEQRKVISQDLRELAHRIDLIRTVALPR